MNINKKVFDTVIRTDDEIIKGFQDAAKEKKQAEAKKKKADK